MKFQYLLGSDLLIAPVIKPGHEKWRTYLPKDNWVHLWTEKEYQGGWIEVEAPIGFPPVFYPKSSPFISLLKTLNPT